ncbi:PcfJ domain-containing protein [Leisingera sp. XS_AS12]|uniref:PcfJ domain-containing protein n=1 Tax=Leisingera sp. XS_AS12 TaxID=3241294 RepID=UPI0035160A91
MQLQTEFRPRDDGADIYMAGSGKDPSWMILRWQSETGRLSGYAASPAHGGLPTVRPVALEHAAITPETVGSMALWTFIASSNLRGTVIGQKQAMSMREQLSEWESFLAGPGKSESEAAPEVSEDESVDLTSEQADWLMSNRFMKNTGGIYTPIRTSSHQVGAPISGFQVLAVRKAIAQVFGHIPSDSTGDIEAARKALSAVERPSSRAVHWYASATGETARDRAQAAASFPVLAGMIADNPLLARAVDNRESLQPLLIKRTHLSKAALKRLGKLSKGLPVGRLFEAGEETRGEDALGVNRLRRFTVSGTVSLDVALKHLSELPPDRMPQDDASWLIYHDVLAGCAIPLENALGIPVSRTLAACKGDWKAFHATLAKAADFDPADFDRRAIALSTIDAIEAIEDFSRTAVLPTALNSIDGTGEAVPDVSNEFFSWATKVATAICTGQTKNTAGSLLEMARRYASRIPTLIEATGYETDDNILPEGQFAHYGAESFPRLMDAFHASNGLVIRNLTSFEMLRRESSRLNHCVGRAYLGKAQKAGCFIFSVQNADASKSYSTIELSPVKGETLAQACRNFSVIQHRARSNKVPPQECKDAEAEWFKKLKDGDLWINFKEIQEWRLAGGAGVSSDAALNVTWKGVIGMEWQSPERRQAAWEEWRYIMGGQFGKSPSPEVIFREKGARDLVAAMNPKAAAILIERSKRPQPAAEAVEAEETAPAGP